MSLCEHHPWMSLELLSKPVKIPLTQLSISYTLRDSSTTSSEGPIIEIVLSEVDSNGIKGSLFANTENDTYLLRSPHTITDTAFDPNRVVEIPRDMALQVTQNGLAVDESRPDLLEYTLDITSCSDLLILTLNEPIQCASINCSVQHKHLDGSNSNSHWVHCIPGAEHNWSTHYHSSAVRRRHYCSEEQRVLCNTCRWFQGVCLGEHLPVLPVREVSSTDIVHTVMKRGEFEVSLASPAEK